MALLGSELTVVAEEFLSDATLRRLSGREDLQSVRFLEMTADTSEETLSDLGHRLPALEELKLSNSNISTLRDLGTALQGLQVLWIARSGLVELEGLGAFVNLRELYAAFNDIVDLSPLTNAERLQLLDLEGNAVDDPSQVLYLSECTELSSLNLQANPFAEAADYRAQARSSLRRTSPFACSCPSSTRPLAPRPLSPSLAAAPWSPLRRCMRRSRSCSSWTTSRSTTPAAAAAAVAPRPRPAPSRPPPRRTASPPARPPPPRTRLQQRR